MSRSRASLPAVFVRGFRSFLHTIAVSGLLAAGGCSDTSLTPILRGNIPPTIEFTQAPISSSPEDPAFYAYRVFWSAHDPDGRVDHVEYCIDPTPTDSVWVRSDRSEEVIFFTASEPEPGTSPTPRALSPHVLVIRAVDHQGAVSPFKTRAFYSWTVAPSVQVIAPLPSALLKAAIVPSVFIRWQGSDPDGQFQQKPVSYRTRMLTLNAGANSIFLSDPDSLRRRDAPTGFADWDSSGAESTFVRLTNLTPRDQWLFAVVAFDEAGAYSPVFSLSENLLQMEVAVSATGPRIHVFNSSVDFTYPSGGYSADPSRWIPVEAPFEEPILFNWDAIPAQGSSIEHYRWAVDIANLTDNTQRTDEERDYAHWSRPSPLTMGCTLRGLAEGTRLLYIEATDNNGFASLGVVRIEVVRARFDSELLIVDDTRREPDKPNQAGTGTDTYKLEWPSAAELDTFLYARGGVPWRETKEPTSGVLSMPGVFAGYSFDTLGTRQGREFPLQGVTFAQLSRFRHVIWLVDVTSATYFDLTGNKPMSVLRLMCSPGSFSAIGTYVRSGGRLWLAGGGAATVSVDEYNSERNDDAGVRNYTGPEGELSPGRLLWDGAHWRSGVTLTTTFFSLLRASRAEALSDAPWAHDDRWTGGVVRSPDYRRLPAEMRRFSPDSDPLPPTRQSRQASSYYNTSNACEYLFLPNFIEEDVDLSESGVRIASTVDTLLEAHAFLLKRNPAPTMTYYHGEEANRFVMSGFAPWGFHRADCIALTDFVLQDLWELRRQSVDRGVSRSADTRPSARPAGRRAGRAAVQVRP